MDADELLDLAGDPRFIEGIYNYCDRWCERCPFTSRCLVYATEEAEGDADRDLSNEAFWRSMQAIFEQTRELIERLAAEQGIDLEAIDKETIIEEKRQKRKRVRKDSLTKAAERYVRMVEEWFKGENAIIERVSRSEAADYFQVIRWYQFQIAVKIMRGLSGREQAERSDGQKDSDGSVKVALIGIDRSIGAWGELQKIFPDKAASIAPILIHLEQMRRKAEQAFPQARNFLRPGFDFMPDVLH
ncbi:MAG: hypothetical protein AB1631_09455 [Acidobacteriota bacterium]